MCLCGCCCCCAFAYVAADVVAPRRQFVQQNYAALRKGNPTTPFLVREGGGVAPTLVARYDFGKESAVDVSGMDAATIGGKLEELVKAGEGMPRSD